MVSPRRGELALRSFSQNSSVTFAWAESALFMAKVITAINKMNKIRQIGIICWKIFSHI
uniref:Uncharacterized protein n=1 Tax=Myoviridae sp. ctcaJ26 TaxID=2825138 RepID=A0A8S5NYN4_9CAUD|nr:MAG TPA: hypothetical protein [Myoviridae sp. ctcaJ26]